MNQAKKIVTAATVAALIAVPVYANPVLAAGVDVPTWMTTTADVREPARPDAAITIDWPGSTRDENIVVLNGQIRRMGSGSRLALTNGGDGSAIRLAIVQGQDGVAKSLTYVGMFSAPTVVETDAPVAASNTVDYVASAGEVSLTWDAIARVREYEIWKDGALIATTNGTAYTDRGAAAASKIHYTVRASQRPLAGDQRTGKVVALGVFVHVPPALAPGTSTEEASAAQLRSGFASAAAVPGNTTIRHTTFIPERFVGANVWCSGGIGTEDRVFGGDDRGFSPTSSRFRTRVDAYVNWRSQFEEIRRWVNDSTLYRENGDGTYTLLDRQNAGVAGITPTHFTWQANPVQKRFNVSHDVGNPFCPSGRPAITASYNGYVYRDQRYILWGSHDQAPNYEVYYKDNTSTTFHLVHLWTRSSFQCLVPLRCTPVEYNESR